MRSEDGTSMQVPLEALDCSGGHGCPCVLKQQALEEGKPEHIVDKMVEGRLQKFFETNCLLKQPSIRDDSVTIEDKLNDLVAACGERVVVARFVRYQVGSEE